MLGGYNGAPAGACCRAPGHQQRGLRADWFVCIRRNSIFWKLKRSLLVSLMSMVTDKSTADLSHHCLWRNVQFFFFLRDHSEGVITCKHLVIKRWATSSTDVMYLDQGELQHFLCKVFITLLSSTEAFWPWRRNGVGTVRCRAGWDCLISYFHCRKRGDFWEDSSNDFPFFLQSESLCY